MDKIQYLENLCFISNSFTIIDDYYEPDLSDLIEIFENDEFILYAIRQENKAFQYASDEIREDKEVVIEAVKQNNKILSYVSEHSKLLLEKKSLNNI